MSRPIVFQSEEENRFGPKRVKINLDMHIIRHHKIQIRPDKVYLRKGVKEMLGEPTEHALP